jgi:hypothetical protein
MRDNNIRQKILSAVPMDGARIKHIATVIGRKETSIRPTLNDMVKQGQLCRDAGLYTPLCHQLILKRLTEVEERLQALEGGKPSECKDALNFSAELQKQQKRGFFNWFNFKGEK